MTEPIGRPSVEDLSDVAWSRVERGVFARLGADGARTAPVRAAPRRWWLAGSIAVAAVAALVIALRAPARPGDGETEWSRVVSGAAPSAVTFGDAHVELDADTTVVLQHGPAPLAWLQRGAAWFSVAPRGERPSFWVFAGDASVRVVGTRFRVVVDGEHTEVAVDHGAVEVRFHGVLARVAAGEAWSSLAPEVASPAVHAAAAPHAAAGPVAPSDPVAPVPPTHTPATGTAPAPPAANPREPHATADPDQQRYEALAKIEAVRPTRAIDGYLELARGSGPWAALALYSAGRLAADRHDDRAAMLLGAYLRRFPSGANADDVRYLLERLQGAPR